MASPEGAGGRRKPWEAVAICVALVIVVFVVFGQTIHFGFVNYDDDTNVYAAPQIVAGMSLRGIEWAFTHMQLSRWAPAAVISRLMDCTFYGTWAGGHHLTNVLLHAAATVFLFLALEESTGRMWRSGFVAAVFAVHPLHVEAVAWVSTRGELLCGLFFMVAVWSYSRYTRAAGGRLYYAASVAAFILGLMSKPMIVTLPFVFLLMDYWPLGRFGRVPRVRLIVEKMPFLVLSAGFSIVTSLTTPKPPGAVQMGLWLRIENAIVTYCIYLRQTFWPTDLAVYYPNPQHGYPMWEVAGAAAVVCLVTAATYGLRRRYPELLAGWLWFAGMLTPVIGIVQISNYAHADRYNYLPQIGLCVAVAWMAADWASRRRYGRAAVGSMGVIVPCVLMVAAYRQTSYWGSSKGLWMHALACTTDNDIAHNDLGNLLLGEGRRQDAIAQYREAARINPRYADARNNLAHLLFQDGHAAEAMEQYQEAVKIDPDSPPIRKSYGLDLFQMGKLDEAAAQFREALRVDPDYTDARTSLANVLLYQGRMADAIDEYCEVLRINPGDSLASDNLGNVLKLLYQQGRKAEAVAGAERALKVNPGNGRIEEALAGMLGDGRR